MDFEKAINEYSAAFERNTLFGDLTPEERSRALVFFRASETSYEKGELLKTAGEAMARFGFILTGTVQVCTDDIDGNRMIMAEVTSGGTFGESLCYLAAEESPIYVYASENTHMMWLRADALRDQRTDEFSRRLTDAFIRLLAGRTLDMNGRIQILSKKSLRAKLTVFLTEYSQKARSDIFTVPFDRNEMAEYLGTERSALSRELSRMRAEGIIDFYRNSFRIL